MPIYEFECKKCECARDVLVAISDMEEDKMPLCKQCDAPMDRIDRVYPTGHVFKGQWFKNSGGY